MALITGPFLFPFKWSPKRPTVESLKSPNSHLVPHSRPHQVLDPENGTNNTDVTGSPQEWVLATVGPLSSMGHRFARESKKACFKCDKMQGERARDSQRLKTKKIPEAKTRKSWSPCLSPLWLRPNKQQWNIINNRGALYFLKKKKLHSNNLNHCVLYLVQAEMIPRDWVAGNKPVPINKKSARNCLCSWQMSCALIPNILIPWWPCTESPANVPWSQSFSDWNTELQPTIAMNTHS